MNQAIQLSKVPKLKSGDDAKAAAQLTQLVADAQNGLRLVVALGLFCYEIKSQLKHGQFKPWLASNCPQTSYRSLAAYMQLTAGVLQKCKLSVKAYAAKVQPLHFSHGGELLLLADKNVPEDAKAMREKICAVIDGKSQAQLFLEFKQVDEDSEEPKTKRGRLKGQGGATKEQRAAAALREEEERVTALKLDAADFTKWCDKNGDDKGVGSFRGSKEWNKLKEAVESLATYMKRADERAAKGGQQ